MSDRRDDGSAPEPSSAWDLGVDDLSQRSPEQLEDLRRVRGVRLALAVGALVGGVLLAALPFGWALAVPATVLLVGGLFAVPVAGYLLHSVTREVARRGPDASGGRPPAS